ncbi:MAG: helix-turn-helix domain-containing protein [Oscillospiraceae bacterium]|nr:helix-turn-helix domain-containing protein [Oscillospiraceae bacterium]
MYDINREKTGTFIAILRKKKGMTQKELAAKLYVSDKAVSKWETGQSAPDVSLLIPLAEILGVTVTELLSGEMSEKEQAVPAEDVEKLVKQTISLSTETDKVKFDRKILMWYMTSFIIGVCGLVLIRRNIFANYTPSLSVPFLLSAVFAAYFCFFTKEKLSSFYDSNRVTVFYDGPFRMNLPGVSFNNKNWLPIVRTFRTGLMIIMAAGPYLTLTSLFLLDFISQLTGITPAPLMSFAVSLPFLASYLLLVYCVWKISKKYE